MYFASVRGDPGRCAKVVPFAQLDADLAAGRLPRLVFITPDLRHDKHGTGEGEGDATLVPTADRWLEDLYGRLAGFSAWRDDTRLVVTWDEGGGDGGPPGCCGGLATGGKVATIIAGPAVKPAGHQPGTRAEPTRQPDPESRPTSLALPLAPGGLGWAAQHARARRPADVPALVVLITVDVDFHH